MACYRPSKAVQLAAGAPIVFGPAARPGLDLTLPCGRCPGCRVDRAAMWARRCMHEASQWEDCCFLTLTYDDDHLPAGGFLVPRHLQLFIKLLRKFVSGSPDCISRSSRISSFRFFACGEYGSKLLRPHYHLLLFNLRFRDTRRISKTLFESRCLYDLWKHGTHAVGDVSAASAAYVAKYSVKVPDLPEWWDEATGEVRPLPFLRMSLRPALGLDWLKSYAGDLSHGYLVVDGTKVGIPRYYKDKLGPEWRKEFVRLQRKRGFVERSDRELNNAEVIACAKARLMSPL